LKPAPDIFLAASKNLGVDTNKCIVIEDALAGVQAAKAAEMRSILDFFSFCQKYGFLTLVIALKFN